MKLKGKSVSKVIVFRALQLGDMLCVIPAIRALRKAYPESEITLAGLPWASSLMNRFPAYFNKFIWFPGYPGLPEQAVNATAFTTFLSQVQSEKYDLALQMQGNGSIVNAVVELFAAKNTAGFCTDRDYCPDKALFISYPDYGSEIDRHLMLMDSLGVPPQGRDLEFPLNTADQKEFNKLELPVTAKKYVCIHPGSRSVSRQWPTAYFAELADHCMEQGFTAVITGTKHELSIVSDVVSQMKHIPVIAAGKTSVGAVGMLINNAYALVSNCTGVSHMAAAFKIPSIVISMDGEPERWAPLNRDLHYVIDWTKNEDFATVKKWLSTLLLNGAGTKT